MSTQASSTGTRFKNRASGSAKNVMGREGRYARIMSQSKALENENDDRKVAIEITACRMNDTSEETIQLGSMRSIAALNDTKNLLQSNASKNIST